MALNYPLPASGQVQRPSALSNAHKPPPRTPALAVKLLLMDQWVKGWPDPGRQLGLI